MIYLSRIFGQRNLWDGLRQVAFELLSSGLQCARVPACEHLCGDLGSHNPEFLQDFDHVRIATHERKVSLHSQDFGRDALSL